MSKRQMTHFFVALLAVASMGAYFFVTENENIVMGALEELKYDPVPNKDGLVGGPAEFKVGKATIEHLEKLHKDGSTLTVDSAGKVTAGKGKAGEGAETSEPQALVDAALKVLKLEQIKDKGGKLGEPSKFRVGREAIEQNRKWQKQGTILVVDAEGKLTPKLTGRK